MSLKKNGISLYYEKEQTEKKCLTAIKSNILAFQYVKKQTIEMCIHVLQQKNINMINLITIKDKILDSHYMQVINTYPELVKNIIEPDNQLILKINPKCIQYINFTIENYYNLCMFIINKDVFKLIPIYNLELYKKIAVYAITNGLIDISHIPQHCQTYEMCFLYFTLNEKPKSYLEDVKKEHKSKYLCDLAFNKNHINIKYIPKEFITLEMSMTSVSKDDFLIKYIPSHIINSNYELIKCNVRFNPYSLIYINFNANPVVDVNKYYELCEIAVKTDGRILKDIVLEYINKEQYIKLCKLAVIKCDYVLTILNFDYINKEQYFEICKIALNSTFGVYFGYINSDLLDKQDYIELIKIFINNRHNKLPDNIKQIYFKDLFDNVIYNSGVICPYCNDDNTGVFQTHMQTQTQAQTQASNEIQNICYDCYYNNGFYKKNKSTIIFNNLYM